VRLTQRMLLASLRGFKRAQVQSVTKPPVTYSAPLTPFSTTAPSQAAQLKIKADDEYGPEFPLIFGRPCDICKT